jgi:alpha-galactosidase
MGDIYKLIFETTRSLKPNSVTQSCPCGTPPSLAWFRYMDQAVTADPISSLQVRRRIKMYKALLGPKAAVYGDHVELTKIIDPNTPKAQQLGIDFASTLGTGGVPGTKFTLQDYHAQFPYIALTPEKEAYWKKWISLYNDNMLSQGEFRNLYTFGYDVPEAYAIEKDGKMFYAFYNTADSPSLRGSTNPQRTWQGKVELRGLKNGSFKVVDYVNNKEIGTVQGPKAVIDVKFEDSLLLEVIPIGDGGS